MWGVAVLGVGMGWAGVAAGAGARAPATVRDGIDMRNLAFGAYLTGGPPCGIGTDHQSVATFSPHGRRFVVVLERGSLRGRVDEYTLLLWKTGAKGPVGPWRLLTMSSSTYYPGIDPATITWSRTGKSMTFLGTRGAGHEQLYRFTLASRTLQALTHSKTSLISFSMDSAGTAWAYGAVGAPRSLWNRGTMAHGLAVTTQSMPSVLFGEIKEPWAEQFSTLYVSGPWGTRRIRPLPGSHFDYEQTGQDARSVSMSPNGRYVIVPETVPYREIPDTWRRYTNPTVQMSFSEALGPAERHKSEDIVLFSRLVLVNVRTGKSRILLNAPRRASGVPVVWSPDSRDVIISHTVLPIGGGGQAAWKEDSVQQTVEVSIRSGAVTPIGRQCAAALSWTRVGLECKSAIKSFNGEVRRALARGGQVSRRLCPEPEDIHFQEAPNGRWRATTAEQAPLLHVFLREGPNSPPELYDRKRNSSHAHVLLNLNPQFRRIALARERLVTWDWAKGHSITAGLYYPPHYQPGRRYPLVIQTHGFQSWRFGYWGAFPTSNAAQPLAAHGIFVLQVNDASLRLQEKPGTGQLEEVRRAMEIYRTAIAYLAGKGLIDPRRVGIIGFSHTCFFVDWALTHDPHLFAAASVTEGGDGSPMEYMLSMAGSVITRSLYGGPPFGKTLANWVKWSPIFHVNRVRAPLLLVNPHPTVTTLFEWEWLHGLRELRRPVQMLVLDGRIKDLHTMRLPESIAVASGESVDWFDFWLNGQEPRGPATRSEYHHWQRLCAEQQRENPGRPVFCVTRSPRRAASRHDLSAVPPADPRRKAGSAGDRRKVRHVVARGRR
jgi:dipeptidyl aminopeptidase/acylaminoacyl peptidase